jgi:hypothetical protein
MKQEFNKNIECLKKKTNWYFGNVKLLKSKVKLKASPAHCIN